MVDHSPNQADIVADLIAWNGTSSRYIFDVTITDPGCKSNWRIHKTAQNEDAGAVARERSKQQKYRRVKDLCVDPRVLEDEHLGKPLKFIPFAIEATGRLGPIARKFLSFICMDPAYNHFRAQFLNSVGAIIAKYNSIMITRCREGVKTFTSPQ